MWEIPFLPAFLFLQLVEQKSSECEQERRLDSGCPVAHALPRGRRAEHGRGLVTGRLRPTQMYARTHAHVWHLTIRDTETCAFTCFTPQPHTPASLLLLLKAAVHLSTHTRSISPGVSAVLEEKKQVIFCQVLLQTLWEVKTTEEKVYKPLQRDENNTRVLVHVEIYLSLRARER